MAEERTLVNAYDMKDAVELARDRLFGYFEDNYGNLFKFPTSEAEDNYLLVPSENATLQELCQLTTEIFSQRNNTTPEPLPPMLTDQDSIIGNAFNIKNKIQYCNNLLRYTLKRRNIDIEDTNSLSSLIYYLNEITPLSSKTRNFVLNKQQYSANEEIIIQQTNILGAYRNGSIKYYDTEFDGTNYTTDDANPTGSPHTINFARSLSINTEAFFDKSIGTHKKIIKDCFDKKHYLSYEIILPSNVLQRIEVDEQGDLIVYFTEKDDLDNTTITTDLNLDNNGDINPVNDTFINKGALNGDEIDNIWIDNDDDVQFSKFLTLTDIEISSDESIVSYYHADTCQINITTKTGSLALGNIPITLYSDTGINEALVTDNNGVATYTYNSRGKGDISFYAESDDITSNNLFIEDCIYFNDGSINDLTYSGGDVSITTDNGFLQITTSTSGEKKVHIPIRFFYENVTSGSRLDVFFPGQSMQVFPNQNVLFEMEFIREGSTMIGVSMNQYDSIYSKGYVSYYLSNETYTPPYYQGKFYIKTGSNGYYVDMPEEAASSLNFNILHSGDKIQLKRTRLPSESSIFSINDYIIATEEKVIGTAVFGWFTNKDNIQRFKNIKIKLID